jgi:hypothetical protein
MNMHPYLIIAIPRIYWLSPFSYRSLIPLTSALSLSIIIDDLQISHCFSPGKAYTSKLEVFPDL